ncbi:hypothetical protein E2C01_056627 [Portunus trituberculatus]|uniref:Uncharacterized protein n=1 Tax=Portunus trituberculatus TaxID=210409 RepID=A0A5B7GRB3_PORTR|nr:hypothetical protein [Portunus trituberculatus]
MTEVRVSDSGGRHNTRAKEARAAAFVISGRAVRRLIDSWRPGGTATRRYVNPRVDISLAPRIHPPPVPLATSSSSSSSHVVGLAGRAGANGSGRTKVAVDGDNTDTTSTTGRSRRVGTCAAGVVGELSIRMGKGEH